MPETVLPGAARTDEFGFTYPPTGGTPQAPQAIVPPSQPPARTQQPGERRAPRGQRWEAPQ